MLNCRQLGISTFCFKMMTYWFAGNSVCQYFVSDNTVLRKLRRAIQDNDFPSSMNSVSEYLVTKRCFPYFKFQHPVWKWRLVELHATRYLSILFQHDDLLRCCELDISTSCWEMRTYWVAGNSVCQYFVSDNTLLRKFRRAIQDNDFPSSKNSVSEYLVTKRCFPYFEFQHPAWKWRLAKLHATRYLSILFQYDDLLRCCELDISTSCWKMRTC